MEWDGDRGPMESMSSDGTYVGRDLTSFFCIRLYNSLGSDSHFL